MSNERRKKRVRLMDVEVNNENMSLIVQYSNYIERTLSKLLNNSNTVYEEDLIKCREYTNKIKRYADCMLGGKELKARVAIKDKGIFVEESEEIDEL